MHIVRALLGAPALRVVLLLLAAHASPSFARAESSTDPALTLADAVATPVQPPFVVHIVNHGTEGRQAIFDPQQITVPQGAQVTWVNDDLLARHAPTADAVAWDADYLDAGQSWSRDFDRPGTFGYICPVHWVMRGSVVVVPSPAVTLPSDDSE